MMKIVLDAGHGNNTPGKRAPDDSMREFHFNNAVAKYMRDMLLNYEDVSVHFVHDETGKHDIALIARTNTANNIKADVYVSIHANASSNEWSTANGIETFHHPRSSETSKKLATIVQNKLIAKTKLRNRGVKQSDFHVLRETDMPSILVECGFMDNKEELTLLKSDSYRRLCAEAIVEGLVESYKLKKKVITNNYNQHPSDWAKLAWNKATTSKIVDGTRPKENITREEVIVILDRLGLIK